MENYIKKIKEKLIKRKNLKSAKRAKMIYQGVGGFLIALGLAGFIASFITFMVLFFKFKTDDAFIAWEVAVPFLVMIVPGSVLARIGDALNLNDYNEEVTQEAEEKLKETKNIDEIEKTKDSQEWQKSFFFTKIKSKII